jgi:tRNA G10  N-methylase Trm11
MLITPYNPKKFTSAYKKARKQYDKIQDKLINLECCIRIRIKTGNTKPVIYYLGEDFELTTNKDALKWFNWYTYSNGINYLYTQYNKLFGNSDIVRAYPEYYDVKEYKALKAKRKEVMQLMRSEYKKTL